MTTWPKALLVDYGGTLVEDTKFNPRGGNEWLLTRAVHRPPHVTLEHVLVRAERVASELSARRDEFQVEVPWPMVMRLVHDFLGVRFEDPMSALELGFWQATVKTRPKAGARDALARLHRANVPVGVVSNCAYGEHVVRADLAQHGLTDHLAFIMVSAEYSVRKPNVLLFDTAAARLGIAPQDIWFVGDRLDTDVAGAKAAGMTAVWLAASTEANARESESKNACEGAPARDADLIVRDWEDLVRQYFQRASR